VKRDESADEARLSRLEKAGVIRRGRRIPRELLETRPVQLAKGVSVVEALLEERRSSER
jgi:hypothetical protein